MERADYEKEKDMDAIEVLAWLKKHNHDYGAMYELFGNDGIDEVLLIYEPIEIVARIEVYEAKKKRKKSKCDKCPSHDSLTDECEVNCNSHLAEEVKKIEKLPAGFIGMNDLANKIDKLVDAVNELRGAK